MDLQILAKRVKLEGSDVDTFVKSKWTETSIEFEVLLRDKNVLLTSFNLKDDLISKKYLKVTFDQLFKALSSNTDQFHFKYSRKFEIFKKEAINDDEDYEVFYLSLPNMKETKLNEDVTEIIASQMEDLVTVCNKLESQTSLLMMAEKDMEDLNEQYYTLMKQKEDYEKNVVAKCCALLNEKKKIIRDGMRDVANDSSFNMHDFILEDGLKSEPTKLPSPVPCTSNNVTKGVTPKTHSSQKRKRTPSKKLFAQITQQSDSDDDRSFDILPDEKSERRKSQDSQNTSSIFKDFKVKTPKKQKREEKESSIEAKMEDNTVRPREFSSPEPDSNPLDIFKCSDDILSQAMDHEMEELSPQKKNPFSVDTINVLEM